MRRSVSDIANEVYGEDSEHIIKSFDQIGDIIVLKIPENLIDERRFILGERILKEFPYINVVLRQVSPVKGLFRIRSFEHLAGELRTYTIYKEHGCRFYVDISKVYFSPRLSYERKRISELVIDGERILNMFAGVGPYSIIIARKRDVSIHSVDINPYAFEYHLINNMLNKVEDRIVTYRDDSANVVKNYLMDMVDRVLMPLPELAIDYLPYAVKAVRDEGWIHIYLHIRYSQDEDEALIEAVEIVEKSLNELGISQIREANPRIVREVATRTAQVCVDIYIAK